MLTDAERQDAKTRVALALELNEPEAMIESLQRMCERKASEAFIHPSDGDRWKNAADALTEVLATLIAANAPQRPADSEAKTE